MSSLPNHHYVQFGCGLCAPENWQNFDASPTLRLERLPILGKFAPGTPYGRFPANVYYGDVIRGLLVPDGSVDLLYCSHVLEHLSLTDLCRALQNCHRILRTGGIFRMVLPDLEFFARQYVQSDSPDAAREFMRSTYLGRLGRPRSLVGFLREWLGNSHHLWMWDYPSLTDELRTAGFHDIRRTQIGDSGIAAFDDVENIGRWENALGIQCIK